ncbi:MAG TPA: hypothetical protein VEY91_01290 [Candidatus Limnocylindria bacterium]|nr:hypothetical protein [Candidatus Limnocylindria bacterium]
MSSFAPAIARFLRPGGVFVAYHFPNRTSWIDFLAARVPGKHHHLYRYDRTDIEALVRGAELELVETRRYAMLPRNTVDRLLGPLGGSRLVAEAWDAADSALAVPLARFCQTTASSRKPGADP